jgi:hypothetical protein
VRLLAITSLAFATRLLLFLSSDEPTGWDGYSYVVQVERLVREGHLHWPDASWVTWYLAALHGVIPLAVVAVKVGACLLAALAVPAAWRLGEVLAPARGGWVLACWAAASPTLTHLGGDFARNLGVVAPFLLVLSWRRADSRLISFGLALCVLLAAVAHRLGAALLVASALGALLGAVLSKWSDRRVLGAGLVLALVFVALSASLPNLLHPADLDRVQGQLTFSPGWPPPLPYFSLRETSWPQRVELLLAWPALGLGCWQFVRVKERRVVLGALVAPLLACVFPLWRTDALDVGYRLSLMAPMFALPLLLAGMATRLRNREAPPVLSERRGRVATPSNPMLSCSLDQPALGKRRLLVRSILFSGLSALIFVLARSGFDPRVTPPYASWRALIARLPRPLPALLIAPQGFNFLYDHETGHESLAWSPESGVDPTTTWRLAWNVRDGEWAEWAVGLEPQPTRLSAEVVYLREDVWASFLERAMREGDDEFRARLADWRNPTKVRPRSLARNH